MERKDTMTLKPAPQRHRFEFYDRRISEGRPAVFTKAWGKYPKGLILWVRDIRGIFVDLMYHDFECAVRDVPRRVLAVA